LIDLKDNQSRLSALAEPRTGSNRLLGLLAAFVMLFGLLLFSSSAFATNNFPGETISGSGSISRSNAGATAETGEPTPNGNAAFQPLNTMWYSWTAASAGTMVVETCSAAGTTFDTVLGAYTGSAVNALTQIAANDDTTGCAVSVNANYGSRVTLQVAQGTTYRIQVDGYGSATGTFLLRYTFTPAAIAVVVTDNSATEGGDTAAFTVRLATQPSATTTVTIAADPSGQCTFAPTILTFTTANFATAQTVTATAVNDVVPEGTHVCSPGSITASGSNYSTVTGTPPTLTVVDNDQGLLIVNTVPTATEGGANGAFTIRLSTLPTGNVTVTIAPDPVTPDQCTFAPTPLTFTTANWNVPQTVTATAVNDLVVEGTHSCTTGTISAAGGGYAGVTGTAPTFTITDNDTGTIVVANTVPTATEGGANGAFTVVLGLQPSGTVTVTIAADPATPDQCTFAPTSLTFTTANWNVPQTVTATAVNDLVVEGTHSCTTGTISAAGGGYAGVTGTAPTFSITDNDTASITLVKTASVASVTVPGQTINYTILITNTGTGAATSITVADTLTTVTCPTSGTNSIIALAPAASETCTASYTALQTDFDTNGGGDGDIDNTASASGTSGGVAVNASDSEAVLCTQNPSLSFSKTAATSGPLVVGQVVRFYFDATNNGNVTLTDISPEEAAFNGNNLPLAAISGEALTDNAPFNVPGEESTDTVTNNGLWSVLKPNDSVRFFVDYTVNQDDIDLLQ
jgi:uncharacterized repeat protein (TIGR01451 family)